MAARGGNILAQHAGNARLPFELNLITGAGADSGRFLPELGEGGRLRGQVVGEWWSGLKQQQASVVASGGNVLAQHASARRLPFELNLIAGQKI